MGADRPTILFYAPEALPCLRSCVNGPRSNSYPLVSLGIAGGSRVDRAAGSPLRAVSRRRAIGGPGLGLVRRLKGDAFTAIVPVVALAGEHQTEVVQEWFSAGSDEVLTGFFSPRSSGRGSRRCGRGPSGMSRSIRPRGFPAPPRSSATSAAGWRRRGVRGVLRGPRPLQGVQRPVQLLRRRPGDLSPVAHPARRGEGAARRRGVRGAHRRRRLHLHRPGRRRSAWCAPRS